MRDGPSGKLRYGLVHSTTDSKIGKPDIRRNHGKWKTRKVADMKKPASLFSAPARRHKNNQSRAMLLLFFSIALVLHIAYRNRTIKCAGTSWGV